MPPYSGRRNGIGMITLFGIRSPLVVEYEETCHRLGIEIAAAVSVNGSPRRPPTSEEQSGLESSPGTEVGREEAILGRADHWIPAGGR